MFEKGKLFIHNSDEYSEYIVSDKNIKNDCVNHKVMEEAVKKAVTEALAKNAYKVEVHNGK